ncbi:helix-turn-helix domain-containing protein [Saccharothrix obliqua]|uniref:helix-turn-helix domain-containing protein n=1 Tax=Saccharothrix obliqua TaxID=2861747 RepID=UPI001C5F2E23|nr:helix-turn-helix domain-containing protein [Saccharothrix obliqua]MBW4719635.1 helix-turn-helix domain-containing protein [Saccharothrix obliqua]
MATTASRTLLSVEEAAHQLSVSRTTMYALLKSGDVTSVLIGRLRRIPLDALRAYIQRLTAQQNT